MRLLEGTPSAFAKAPSNYELCRDALGHGLDVPSHSVTLVGSARFGFSYASKKWPKTFVPGRSDYDFLVCDLGLFEQCAEDVARFTERAKLAMEGVTVDGAGELTDRMTAVGTAIRRGFIDQNALRPIDLNPTFKKLVDVANEVSDKYQRELRFSRVKLRVYRDWDIVMNQNVLNLRANLADLVRL